MNITSGRKYDDQHERGFKDNMIADRDTGSVSAAGVYSSRQWNQAPLSTQMYPTSLISWSSVTAGVLIALVLSLCLGLLGLGIGLGTINPATEQEPLSGVTWGTGIWSVFVALVALFSGGFVSGRLSGRPQKWEGIWHGLISWAVVTLIGFYIVGGIVSSLVSSAASLIGQTLDTVGTASAAGMAQVSGVIQQAAQDSNITLNDIQEEASRLLRQSGEAALQPKNLENAVEGATNTLQQGAEQAAKNPQSAGQELQAAIRRMAAQSTGVIEAIDQDAVVNVLVARTGMNRDEARRTVAQWADQLNRSKQQIEEFGTTVKNRSLEAVEAGNDALASASFWTFIALAIGAVAAAFGGMAGAKADASRIVEVRE